MKLRKLILVLAMILAILPMSAQTEKVDTLSVAVGTYIGEFMRTELDKLQMAGLDLDRGLVIDVINKSLRGMSTGFDVQSAYGIISAHLRASQQREEALSAEAQQAFVDSIGAIEGAVTTPSGLVFITEVEGSGAIPTDSDTVEVLYTGRFSDGSVFDTTETPISFAVPDVTPGFSEGLKMMRAGGCYRIVMPASLGYGAEGIPGAIPGNAALDFTVELVSISATK